MFIYVKITKKKKKSVLSDRQTQIQLKTIVRNLTKKKYKNKKKLFYGQTYGQPKTIVQNLTK